MWDRISFFFSFFLFLCSCDFRDEQAFSGAERCERRAIRGKDCAVADKMIRAILIRTDDRHAVFNGRRAQSSVFQ